MKTMKLFTILFASLMLLSCSQPTELSLNEEQFIYVTKNTFSGDFLGGLEIHGNNEWNGDLKDATHVIFDRIDHVGNVFPVADTIYARGFSGGATFNYKLGRQPTNDFLQYTVENVTESETSGAFIYGVRYSVRIIW